MKAWKWCDDDQCTNDVSPEMSYCTIHASRPSMKCKTSNCTNAALPMRDGWCEPCSSTPSKPSHYQGTGMQAIDVIEAFKLGYNLSSVIKYILRADRKGCRESDLDKAINFLWRERYGTWRP